MKTVNKDTYFCQVLAKNTTKYIHHYLHHQEMQIHVNYNKLHPPKVKKIPPINGCACFCH